MADNVDPLAAYLAAAAKSPTAIPQEIVWAMADGLRARQVEKAKFNNIMNYQIAQDTYLRGISLGNMFGVPQHQILPYPGHGNILNIQTPSGCHPTQPQPAPCPPPRQPRTRWLWPLVAATLLGTAGALGGYIYGQQPKPETPPTTVTVTPNDADVGIEIDG